MSTDKQLNQLTELTTVADDDLVYVVDISDTTEDAAGSSRKAQAKNVRGWPQTSAESSAGVTPTNYQYEPGDVRRYGAVGDGSTDDGTAINNAMLAAEQGNGVVYFPATSSFYKITQPIYVRDGVRVYGDGYFSHVKNTRTSSATSGDLRCFDFGNHTSTSLLAETAYALDAISEGDKTVTTSTASDAGNFSAGDVVYIASDSLAGSAPVTQEFNEVLSAVAGTGVVTLKYGVHAAFSGGQKIYKSTSSQTDPLGNTRRVVSRCHISDLRITCAGSDWWHAAGGCWESTFENLYIDSRSPTVINAFARSVMRNIYATFDDRAIEFAIGCHDSVMENFDLTFKTTGQTTTSEPICSINEGAHNIVVRNGTVNASDHAGSRCVRFITSKDCLFDGVLFRAPSVTGSSMIDFSASSGYCQRNIVSNVDVHGDNSRFIQFDYGAGVTGQDNRVTGSRFYGTASDDAAVFVDGTRDFVGNCYFESGGYNIGASSTNCSLHSCEFEERHPSRTVSASADLRDIKSASTVDLRSVERFEVNDVITSTTPNNTVHTVSIPADTLEVGDVIEVFVAGNVSGTNDTKEIRVEAESTDVGSISLTAGQSGAFSIRATIAVLFTTTTKRGLAQEESAAGANTRRTSFNLNTTTGTMNVDLEAWVANASDSITIDSYVVRPVRKHELTP